jgi:S-layer protein (TIGR01567 family)
LKKTILQIISAFIMLALFCGAANAAPTIIASEPLANSTVQGFVGDIKSFSVQTNEKTAINWLVDGVTDKKNTNYYTENNTSTLKHVIKSGTYEIKATVTSNSESIFWTIQGTENQTIPVITSSDPSTTNVTNNIGESRTFTAAVNQISNITWFLDGTPVQTNNSVSKSSYTTSSESQGKHNVEVEAQIGNETPASKSWTWTVGSSTSNLSIAVAPVEGTVLVSQGGSQLFNVNSTNGQNINVEWLVNDESMQTDENVTSSPYTFEESNISQYILKAIVDDSNGDNSTTLTWTVNVQSASYSSGNRIWDESQNMSTNYTWDAQSFSGFYYDLDTGISSENMTITDISRSIDSGNIKYVTSPTDTKFKHNDWGSYQVIGFMAEKYFAGYTVNSLPVIDNISPISDGILSKILIDSDDKSSFSSGESLALEEGYSLSVKEVDINGNSVLVDLEKDGKVVDETVVSSGGDYIYKTSLGTATDVPVIIIHFGTVFSGAETSAVFVQGIFQISDNYVEVKNGDDFGEMEVKSIGSDEIEMENTNNIGLNKGETVDLMGNIQIQVANNDTLRFAPVENSSESGTIELRGTVYDQNIDGNNFTWTPYNFEGLYYNMDEGIGTEKLDVQELDGRTIPSNKLVYQSTPEPVNFEHADWGDFTVVGFNANEYFAGYTKGAVNGSVDEISLLSNSILTKVLTDNDDKSSFSSGESLALEEGYSLSVKEVDINGNSVLVDLEKDGKVVDETVVSSGGDYIYKTSLGAATDTPLIIIHFGTVFSGAETSAVFVQGIFQISENYIEIKNGDSYGDMQVTDSSESGIRMENSNDIGLDQNQNISIMSNISFRTADSSTLRFYPFVEVQSGGSSANGLNISVPDEIAAGSPFDITITADGNPIEGVNVKVDGNSTGNTSAEGTVQYTAEKNGTLTLTAEMNGYSTVSKNVNVLPTREEMSLSVYPETIYIGDNITITALKKIGGDPIIGANISLDGQPLGVTGSDGNITYKTEKNGTIKVSATKEGFNNNSIDVVVKDFEPLFTVSNLTVVPKEVDIGKNATVSAIVVNTGKAAGNYNASLSINGNVTDSKEVFVDVGGNATVTFAHSEKIPGNYTVELGGQTVTYTVKESSPILLYTLGAIVLLLIGGAAYYFTKKGGDIGALQEKVQELISSIKPKK